MDSFAETIGRLLMIHARVKAIDRDALSEKRKVQRAKQMRDLRRSADALVTKTFADLSDDAKASAEELNAAAKELEDDLAAQKTAVKILDAVGSALGAITKLVGLLA